MYSNQAGGWSSKGVYFDKDNSDDTKVTCLATHLTSFAVLVSIGDEPTTKVLCLLSVISTVYHYYVAV